MRVVHRLTAGSQSEGSGEGGSGLGWQRRGVPSFEKENERLGDRFSARLKRPGEQKERVESMPGMSEGSVGSSRLQSARRRPLCGNVRAAFWPHVVFQ